VGPVPPTLSARFFRRFPKSGILPWTIFSHPLAILLFTCHANLVEMSKTIANSFCCAALTNLAERRRTAALDRIVCPSVQLRLASHQASHVGPHAAARSIFDFRVSPDFLTATVAQSTKLLSCRKENRKQTPDRNKTSLLGKRAFRFPFAGADGESRVLADLAPRHDAPALLARFRAVSSRQSREFNRHLTSCFFDYLILPNSQNPALSFPPSRGCRNPSRQLESSSGHV
jgi:hypothetical protein